MEKDPSNGFAEPSLSVIHPQLQTKIQVNQKNWHPKSALGAYNANDWQKDYGNKTKQPNKEILNIEPKNDDLNAR